MFYKNLETFLFLEYYIISRLNINLFKEKN
jgi:hypothetical protein